METGQTMYEELKDKLIGLDFFMNESHLKDKVLYIANVEMEYEMYSGSWEKYMDCTVDVLKINTETKEVVYAQHNEHANYRNSDCDCCSSGYDFGEEQDYIGDTWHEITQIAEWQSLNEVNVEELDYDAKTMVSVVKEYLQGVKEVS